MSAVSWCTWCPYLNLPKITCMAEKLSKRLRKFLLQKAVNRQLWQKKIFVLRLPRKKGQGGGSVHCACPGQGSGGPGTAIMPHTRKSMAPLFTALARQNAAGGQRRQLPQVRKKAVCAVPATQKGLAESLYANERRGPGAATAPELSKHFLYRLFCRAKGMRLPGKRKPPASGGHGPAGQPLSFLGAVNRAFQVQYMKYPGRAAAIEKLLCTGPATQGRSLFSACTMPVSQKKGIAEVECTGPAGQKAAASQRRSSARMLYVLGLVLRLPSTGISDVFSSFRPGSSMCLAGEE